MEKKEITITKEQFQLASAEAGSKVISKLVKDDKTGEMDVEMALHLSMIGAMITGELSRKLFNEEKKED